MERFIMTTKNYAQAVIQNNSSKTFVSIGLSHKYSDVFKDQTSWAALAPGQTSTPPLTVEYNTGFGTTGQDWWYILAVDSEGNIWNTNPSNARWLWDGADSLIQKFGSTVAGWLFAGATITEGTTVIGAGLIQLLTMMTNNESTAGFKEFLLRSEDAGQTVTITLTDTNIHFSAPSGIADTPLSLAQAAPAKAST
jgi:hypothetical protein